MIVLFALLVTILVPSMLGGLSFVWCVPMARVQSACCCHRAQTALRREARGAHGQAPSIEATCCESHRVDSLPPSHAALDHDALVPPCPLIALRPVAPLPCENVAPAEPWERLRSHPSRAGPRAPLFDLHCSYLN